MRAFGNLPDAEKRGHGYLYQRGMQQQIALAVGMGSDLPQLQEVLDRMSGRRSVSALGPFFCFVFVFFPLLLLSYSSLMVS